MRITVTSFEGQEFDLGIRFMKVKRIIRKKSPVIDTVCKIYFYDEHGVANLLADSIARQSPKDRYNKITGKKIALARALQQIVFLRPGHKNIPEIETVNKHKKSMRQMIWKLFVTTFRIQTLADVV